MQAKGVGKWLMQGAETHAQQLHCRRIYLTVISARTELIAWYQRRGYQLTGETKPFPDQPEFGVATQPLEFVVMEKWLHP
jgi:ribosomal protein S18 acetylase RimI-like enzyme